MPNEFYRTRIRDSIEAAVLQYRAASAVTHPGMQGRIREIAAQMILEPLMFNHLSIGHGKITDYRGSQSSETDCIIYSTKDLPPILYDRKLGIFPIDAVFAAVEIKSQLSAQALSDSYAKAVSIWKLAPSTGRYEERDGHRVNYFTPPVLAVFAFDSDLSGEGKTEIQRYFEVDSEASVRPTIQMICVVGKGFWWYRYGHNNQRGAWIHCGATSGHDETITFAALLISMIVGRSAERPAPRIEPYLINLRLP
jgi:hypothetical protein